MEPEKLFFSKIQESRGEYFVEYLPPRPESFFATLNVVFPTNTDIQTVIEAMERETRAWVSRYPVPVMALAFDSAEDIIELSALKGCNHVLGTIQSGTRNVSLKWEEDFQSPHPALSAELLKQIYRDVPYRTEHQVSQEADNYARKIRTAKILLCGWFAVIPAVWAFTEWAGPRWLETAVFVFALWKASKIAANLYGLRKKTPRELEKEQREMRMRHYFYHCELNPQGFLRLKAENLEREIRAGIQREASELKAGTKIE